MLGISQDRGSSSRGRADGAGRMARGEKDPRIADGAGRRSSRCAGPRDACHQNSANAHAVDGEMLPSVGREVTMCRGLAGHRASSASGRRSAVADCRVNLRVSTVAARRARLAINLGLCWRSPM